MKEIARLTDLEIRIMRVLWEHERDLTIQEIGKQLEDEGISVASVAQSVKHLIKKKAVVVSEHVLVASVYARTFRPCYDQEEFLKAEFCRLQKSVLGSKRINMVGVAMSLLTSNENKGVQVEDVEELQNFIDKKKEQLLSGEE